MGSNHQGTAVVIMGVSGAGKSTPDGGLPGCLTDFHFLRTVGEMLGKALNCSYIDADDFHPQSNKEKMKNGIPLSDEDRIPWLETLRSVVNASLVGGKTVVLGCSALKKHYRDILRSADPNYEGSLGHKCVVKFVMLEVGMKVLIERVKKRAAEGKHFMPPQLLQSQIDLLQIDESEGIFRVDASLSPQEIVDNIKASLF